MSKTTTKIGTYGRIISIKYFLNTKLKPSNRVSSYRQATIILAKVTQGYIEPDRYPLYIMVNVKRQPTQIKSMLDLDIAVDEFDEVMSKYSEELEYEKRLIEKSILAAKPFDSSDFSITEALRDYRMLAQDFGDIIARSLRIVFQNTLKHSMHTSGIYPVSSLTDEQLIPHGNEIQFNKTTNPLGSPITDAFSGGPFAGSGNVFTIPQWVKYLQGFIPEINDLYDKLGPDIWYIQPYFSGVKMLKRWSLITIDDWNDDSRFNTAFMENYNNVVLLNSLRMSVIKLRSIDNELDRLLMVLD